MEPEREVAIQRARHLPAFDELCDHAKRVGLQVRLHARADPSRVGDRCGGELYWPLDRIELWETHLPGVHGLQHYGGTPLACAWIGDGDLEAAALDLLNHVA
jgi:hypothetical protein